MLFTNNIPLVDYIQNVGTGTVLDLTGGMFDSFISFASLAKQLRQALTKIVCDSASH